jgi:hypothetical protein
MATKVIKPVDTRDATGVRAVPCLWTRRGEDAMFLAFEKFVNLLTVQARRIHNIFCFGKLNTRAHQAVH